MILMSSSKDKTCSYIYLTSYEIIIMGIYKKSNTYWFKKVHMGRKVEKSLHVKSKRLASLMAGKIEISIIDGSYFQKPQQIPMMKESNFQSLCFCQRAGKALFQRDCINGIQDDL